MPSDTWDVLMIKFIFVVKHLPFCQLIIKLGFIHRISRDSFSIYSCELA